METKAGVCRADAEGVLVRISDVMSRVEAWPHVRTTFTSSHSCRCSECYRGALHSKQTARGPPADEAKFGIHARDPTTLPWFPGKFNSQYSALVHAAETEEVGQTSVVFALHTSQEG